MRQTSAIIGDRAPYADSRIVDIAGVERRAREARALKSEIAGEEGRVVDGRERHRAVRIGR